MTTQTTIDRDTGKTIPEIEVQPIPTAYTDSDGKYALANVPAGRITITAHNPQRDKITREITLGPGDNLPVDFLIPPNPMVSGRVLDPDMQPESGIKVWAVESSSVDGIAHYNLFGPRLTVQNSRMRVPVPPAISDHLGAVIVIAHGPAQFNEFYRQCPPEVFPILRIFFGGGHHR